MSEGPEAARMALGELWRSATSHISEFGGAVFNLSEHDMLALWGSESAREDDPERAVHAALAIRDTMQERVASTLLEDEPLPIRIGINTGLALLTRSDETGAHTASGATIGLASRVADIADGLVLITKDTLRHVQGVFEILPDAPVRVRRAGGRTLVNTYRVTAPKPRAFKLQSRGVEGVDTHMIGRRGDLEQLQKAFINAVEESEAQIVTIVGEPGLGKSRLMFEFASWSELRPELYYIFRGRATPAMTNRPYALWRELLSFRLQILDSDTPDVVQEKMESGVADLIGANDEIAHLIGHLAGFEFGFSPHVAGEPQVVNEMACRAVSQFFNRLTLDDPVVLQLDDLHHADDASLDLITELVSTNQNMPLMVVGTARTNLFERRPAWGSGQNFHTNIELQPLDKRDSRDLVSEILQKVDELPRYLRDLIVERSEGNPYYMEELIKMLIEDRVIQKLDKRHWTIEDTRLNRLRVPPTLVGLLQARFDSLLYPEKLTLQRAAVIGRVFHDNALRSIDAADQTHVDDLDSTLTRLVAREFIYIRETSAFAGSREYIFAQAMLRDLILETILRRQRSTYSRATAVWLAAQGGERAGEYDGLIAEYYEDAGELTQAAEYFTRAGDAAVARGALVEAVRLQEKGLALLNKEEYPAEYLYLLLGLGATHSWMGAYDKAYAQLRPALAAARALGDRLAEANALAQLGRIAGIWLGDFETGLKDLLEALQIARQLEDVPILIFILRQLGNHGFVTGDHDAASTYLEESLALAREADALGDAANALNSLGENSRYQGNFESALNYYSQALKALDQQDNPSIRAMVSTNMGFTFVEQGDYDAARRIGEETLEITREIGTEYLIAGCYLIIGGAAVGLGDYDVARQNLAHALDMFQEMGNLPELLATIPDCALLFAKSGDMGTALAWLGMVLAHPSLSAFGRLRAEKALDELRTDLSEDEVEAAIRQGSDLEIDLVLEQFKA